MRAGFTLVEVVVALVVLEIGVLGVMGTLLLASRALSDAEIRERAVLETLRVVDSLAVDGMGGPGRRTFGWGAVQWTAPAEGGAGTVVALDEAADTLVNLELPWRP